MNQSGEILASTSLLPFSAVSTIIFVLCICPPSLSLRFLFPSVMSIKISDYTVPLEMIPRDTSLLQFAQMKTKSTDREVRGEGEWTDREVSE